MTRHAILAHWNAEGLFDEVDREILEILQYFHESVHLVSTNLLPNEVPGLREHDSLSVRQNFGHDFASYALGFDSLVKAKTELGTLTLCNNSFEVSDQGTFKSSVNKVLERSSQGFYSGISMSHQFTPHIQSYFVSFDVKRLGAELLQEFFSKLGFGNSKDDVIQKGEIGLSELAKLRRMKPFWVLSEPNSATTERIVSNARIFKAKEGEPRPIFGGEINPVLDYPDWFLKSQIGIRKRSLVVTSPVRTGVATSKNILLKQMVFDNEGPSSYSSRVAVVCHLHFSSSVAELLSELNLIPEHIDLFVSVTSEDLVPLVINNRPLNTKKLVIELQENRGRDIGAFIRFLNNPDSTKYDCVLKLHGKKSEGGILGDTWRTRLIRNLAPSPKEIRKIVNSFIENPSTGIAGPREFHLNISDYLGGNATNLENLETRLGLGGQNTKSKFFAGSMFWFRPKALEGLKSLAEDSLPEELGQIDGTWLHSVERLVILQSETQGYSTIELIPTFEGEQTNSSFLKHHYFGQTDESN